MSTRYRPMSRRSFVQAAGGAAGGAAAGSLLVPGSAGATSHRLEPRLAAQGGTEVRALMWSNGPIIDGHFEDRVAAFNEAHAGEITVTLEFQPYDQYWQRLQLAYASDDIYDVYFWDVQAYGHYKRDLLLNLQPMIDEAGALNPDEYPVDLFAPWRLDGENLYGMPENFQTNALYFNIELFEAAGLELPDNTWGYDQILEAALALTQRDGDRVNQWGMGLGNLSVWWGQQTISWARGDAFFDRVLEPTQFQFSNDVNVQTLDFVRSLIHDHQVAPTPSVAAETGEITGFGSGRTGFQIEGSWAISGYAELPFEWGMTPIPMTDGNRVVPYWMGGWVIPQTSEVPEAAFEWARWSGDEYQEQMAAEKDWIPIKTSVRESDITVEGMPEGYREVLDALGEARIGDFYSDNTQQIWVEVFDPNLTQLMQENAPAEEVAAAIDEEANAMLEG